MHIRNLSLAILVFSIVAFAQNPITADSPFQVRYAANLNLGESYVDIINTGANGSPLITPSSVGNICVNVYAFDPTEEMIACCACLVTPDQVVSLGVNKGILSNSLVPNPPTSVVVKLLSTLPPVAVAAFPVPGTCNPGTVNTALQAKGMLAYGTTLHVLTNGSIFGTETPFGPATLSQSELQTLATRCSFILANGSGFGICKTCQVGGQ